MEAQGIAATAIRPVEGAGDVVEEKAAVVQIRTAPLQAHVPFRPASGCFGQTGRYRCAERPDRWIGIAAFADINKCARYSKIAKPIAMRCYQTKFFHGTAVREAKAVEYCNLEEGCDLAK